MSAANLFGEIVEWTGFAIAAGTLASWAFIAFVLGNLVPRGIQNHNWYERKRKKEKQTQTMSLFFFLNF